MMGISQTTRISLDNPSFEDMPRHSKVPQGWFDCGMQGESPPDIQPGAFDVTTAPKDGFSYIGLVTRDNETWEGLSQRLSTPLRQGNCYQFKISLAYSKEYYSASRTTEKDEFYTKPVLLRIWGGNTYCDKKEILAESPIVKNAAWEDRAFVFKPQGNYKFIIFEAYYKTPTLFPYNGNLLLDDASEIIQKEQCDDIIDTSIWEENPIAKKEETPTKKTTTPKKKNTITPNKKEEKPKEEVVVRNDSSPAKKKEEIIPTKKDVANQPKETSSKPVVSNDIRDVTQVQEGQIIRINQLDFAANSHEITEDMHSILDELYIFIKEHPGIIVEIGGHTNRIPSHDHCNKLSKKRALAVTNYLVAKGLTSTRLKYRGYGKTQPIDTSNTPAGRKKNQRVEIKILSLKG